MEARLQEGVVELMRAGEDGPVDFLRGMWSVVLVQNGTEITAVFQRLCLSQDTPLSNIAKVDLMRSMAFYLMRLRRLPFAQGPGLEMQVRVRAGRGFITVRNVNKELVLRAFSFSSVFECDEAKDALLNDVTGVLQDTTGPVTEIKANAIVRRNYDAKALPRLEQDFAPEMAIFIKERPYDRETCLGNATQKIENPAERGLPCELWDAKLLTELQERMITIFHKKTTKG